MDSRVSRTRSSQRSARPTPPDPPLSDGVVTLRPWRESDVAAIAAALDGDPEVTRWLVQIPQPYGESDAREYVALTQQRWGDGTWSIFAITVADEVAGSIGIHWQSWADSVAEVGYWVAREARGRGIAAAALGLVSRWALGEVGIGRLQLKADAGNPASQRVAEQAGFTREGVLRSLRPDHRHGGRVDMVIFSLLPGELG